MVGTGPRVFPLLEGLSPGLIEARCDSGNALAVLESAGKLG